MLEVPDQLTQDPRLVGIGDPAELLLHDGLGEDLRPREVVQLDLPQLAPVDLGRMLPRDRRDLVGDGDDGVEAVLTRDVEVVLKLLCGQLVAAGLDLDERHPALRASAHANEPVGIDLLVAENEGDLDEALDVAGRRPQRLEQDSPVLLDGPHHRHQSGCGSSFLLLGAVDSRRRDEPRFVPRVFSHAPAFTSIRFHPCNHSNLAKRHASSRREPPHSLWTPARGRLAGARRGPRSCPPILQRTCRPWRPQ